MPIFAGKVNKMHGLVSQLVTVDGKRDELIRILPDAVSGMPGCPGYVVGEDAADANALWVTEVRVGREKRQASLSLPAVRKAMGQGRPLIADIGTRVETVPVEVHGI